MQFPQFSVDGLHITSPFSDSNAEEKDGIEYSTAIILREALQGIGEYGLKTTRFAPYYLSYKEN